MEETLERAIGWSSEIPYEQARQAIRSRIATIARLEERKDIRSTGQERDLVNYLKRFKPADRLTLGKDLWQDTEVNETYPRQMARLLSPVHRFSILNVTGLGKDPEYRMQTNPAGYLADQLEVQEEERKKTPRYQLIKELDSTGRSYRR